VTVSVRSDSATGFQLARLLTRLDRAELLQFESADDGPWLAATCEGERSEGRPALLRIARALPLGRWAVPALRVLSLGIFDAALGQLDARHAAIGRWLGLRATSDDAAPLAGPTDESALRRWLGRWRIRSREAVLAFLMLCLVSEIINANKSIPKQLHHKQLAIMRAVINYPRLYQGWGMFAPNPVREDGFVTVDAVTVDGRHIDPFTGQAPDMDLTDARGFAAGQIVQDYFNRIRLDRNKVYRQQMSEWIQRYHLRTGNPNDEIVAFDAYWLIDQNPDPPNREPFDHHSYCIHSWRKGGYRPARGLPALPPQCKVVSGEPAERGDVRDDAKNEPRPKDEEVRGAE
jgi:hypothetical protein